MARVLSKMQAAGIGLLLVAGVARVEGDPGAARDAMEAYVFPETNSDDGILDDPLEAYIGLRVGDTVSALLDATRDTRNESGALDPLRVLSGDK